MASNYKLNLQCVLDTTQVKQELQKLRQMQNQILGNNKNSVGNVSGRNNAGLGNLAGLNSTLSRLTNSINQLNATINKIQAYNYRNTNATQSVYTSSSKNGANIPLLGSTGLSRTEMLKIERSSELYKNSQEIQKLKDSSYAFRQR